MMSLHEPIDIPLVNEIRLIHRIGLLCLLFLFLVTAYFWQVYTALQWLVQATLIWWYVFDVTVKRVSLNRVGSSAPLDPDLGPANHLTIIRGGLIAATGGFLFLEPPPGVLLWMPGIFYCTAAILDRLDGYVARRTGRTSLLGVELDTVFDALGLAVAPMLAVWYGKLHWSYLVFSAAWYLFRWGTRVRERAGLPIHALTPNPVRRAWAGFQMGFIGVVLLPVFESSYTRIAGVAFVIPVLSGFLIDWLVVSGRLVRSAAGPSRFFSVCDALMQYGLLPLLRSFIFLLVYHLSGWPDAPVGMSMFLAAGLVLAGFSGRAAAVLLVILGGISHPLPGTGPAWMVLLSASIWIMMFGTGRFSLWKPDERWINRYDGA